MIVKMTEEVFLSLLHPTRERMELCLETTRRWSDSVEGSGIAVEHLVAIDEQDAEVYADFQKAGREAEWFGGRHAAEILSGTRLNVNVEGFIENLPTGRDEMFRLLTAVNKVNRLARRAKGGWLFFIADDFQPVDNGWLPEVKAVLDRWDPAVERIVMSPEADGRALINHPIMSRAFYASQDCFFYPEYLHVCVDCDLHLVATLERALHHLPPETCARFKHHNPYLNAEAKWDKVYGIGNNAALYAQGAEVFARRKVELAERYGTAVSKNDLSATSDGRPHALNIGCGTQPRASTPDTIWINMDQASGPGVDVVRDIRRGFPFADSTFDELLMDNVLEHFNSEDVIFLLNEIHRVAKPGARVMIIVPHAHSQGAVQDPTHKSLFVPRSALYWNQHDTPYGGHRVGISANLRLQSATITGDLALEAFIHFSLVADKT